MNFDIVINRVLKSEGGYVNNPADPGGETNFGIAKRNHPNVDIANLTRDGAIAIYKSEFWVPVHGDQLPDALAFQAMDFAVNSGISTAIRKLQAAAGVADDGVWGPHTQAAVAACNPIKLTLNFISLRGRFWAGLPQFSEFGRGWTNRLCDDIDYAAQDLVAQ